MPKQTGTVIPRGIPFAQIPHAITLDLDVTTAAFRVYGLLMKLANAESRAWPGHRYLEDHLPMTRKTVASALRCLEDTGWLVIHKEQMNHTYTVVVEQTKLDLEWGTNHTGGEMSPVQKLHRTGAETTPEVVQKLPHIDNHDRQPTTDNQLAETAKRNVTWDFITDTGTWNLATKTEAQRRRVGKLVRELSAKLEPLNLDGYDREWAELVYRAGRWPHHFPNATLTAEAFEKHFELLGSPPLKRTKSETTRQTTRKAIEVLTRGAYDS